LSFSKNDQVFPSTGTRISEVAFAKSVAEALRNDYADIPSTVKQISRQTGAQPRAIRNWYEGKHIPSSLHLLILAKSSPSILQLVLKQIGGDDLFEAFRLLSGDRIVKPLEQEPVQHITDKIVSIDQANSARLKGLNRRQIWFYSQLKQGRIVSAKSIVQHWQVKERTAWRDIQKLTNQGVISFIGNKRRGEYILC